MKYAIPVLLGYVNGQKGNDLLFEIPSVLTVIIPVPHSDELPKPIFYYLLSGMFSRNQFILLSLCNMKDL